VVQKRSAELSSPSALRRAAREFRMLSLVRSEHIVRALELDDVRGILTLEHLEGRSLAQLAAPLVLDEFWGIAADVCKALTGVHEAQLIHKDVCPANLVRTESGRTKLIDFELATRSHLEVQAFSSVAQLEGTLAFMAPEQTGRTHRLLDYRADLYALGATFYYLLSGHPPFEGRDPLELLHKHAAVTPAALTSVPKELDRIVQKLLAKNAEDRYQSAAGVAHDLAQARAGTLTALAEQDVSHRLTLPGRLIGRDAEHAVLSQAFARVTSEGTCRLVLVGGYSGVGKTSLVREVHRPLVKHRGYFLYGKFDQLRRNEPYAALVNALDAHVRVLMGEPEAELEGYRRRLRESLGAEALALSHFLPVLKPLLGAGEASPGLSPRDVQTQAERLVQRLFQALAASEHPLVLFLDDLQWADPATLNFVERAVREARSMLIVGAYRDNEVGPSHPLLELFERVIPERVDHLKLAPLELAHVVTYTAETLHTSRDEVSSLADLLHQRTLGNPFFLGQALLELYHTGVLQMRSGRWTWDGRSIELLGLSENAADITAQRIQRTDVNVRRLLRAASCLGNDFELADAAEIAGLSEQDAESLIEQVLAEGFISRRGDRRYSFLHDRVRRAAYDDQSESCRRKLHRDIAMTWLKRGLREARLFELASHATLAVHQPRLDEDPELAQHAVSLNLAAAQRAYASGAFEIAAHHAETSRHFLHLLAASNSEAYRQATSIYGDAQYSSGHYPEAHAAYDELLNSEQDPIRRSATHRQKAVAKTVEGRLEEAFGYFGVLARELGFDFNTTPTNEEATGMVEWARETLVEFGLSELDSLPPCEETSSSVLIDACLYFGTVAYLSRPASFKALQSYTVIHCFDWGVAASAPPMITAWAYSAASARDYPLALAVAERGCRLADKYSPPAIRSRAHTLFALFAVHYERPITDCLEALRTCADTCASHGDLEYAGYARVEHDALLLLTQAGSVGVHDRLARSTAWARDFNVVPALRAFATLQDFLQALSGAGPYRIDRESRSLGVTDGIHSAREQGLQVVIRVLMGDYVGAAKSYERFIHVREHLEGTLTFSLFSFFGAVALLRGGVSDVEDGELLVCEAAELVRLHATTNPHVSEPYRHVLELITTPRREVKERLSQFEEVLRAAGAFRVPLLSALTAVLAAEAFRETGDHRLAHSFAEEAVRSYGDLGAHAVAHSLQQRFADVGVRPAASSVAIPTADTTSFSDPRTLDLWAVVKASQTLASEIRLEPLISRLLGLTCQSAGAQRAVLLTGRSEDLTLSAELRDGVENSASETLAGTTRVPESMILDAFRHGEPLVLHDALADANWGGIEYFRRTKVRSVLCMPIRQGDERFGLLYLENTLAAGAFHAGRIEVLRILASQAAVSLGNARLLREEAEKQRLSSELEAASEIQRSLVPASPKLRGCEVSAHMTPADLVGGDYYDVIHSHGVDWFAIGDVCGHGLPAGLIMIMCQTALHAVLLGQSDVDPASALVQVNRLLKQNLERFQSSTYVALTLFRHHGDGMIEYAGLHEDLLVYRARSGQVEAKQTNGTWLGILEDLAPILTVSRLQLELGDTLLLYTDGVTEARTPVDGEMLGRVGLEKVLSESGTLPLDTIKARILAVLENYRSSDDITLFLLRRSV
jgi:serine phosphatase RsbU (regulator of sigma subunit)/tRNA A-37 threonylcarbamoyl transferase component Bud32/tetratricopeptide (TPR) repeat protein